MNDYPWYGLASGDLLEQGDLIVGCPFHRMQTNGDVERKNYDVVVLSHSCDLAHDKLDFVQVCSYWELEAMVLQVEYFRGKRGREELRRGNLPGYHLLNRCMLVEKPTDHLGVDFRSQFSVNREDLKMLATAQQTRLRLLPPYREHLAQALARFYMRVGLPVDIPAF